jgi:predicted nucleotidyltransferase
MVDMEDILAFSRAIAQEYQPEQIILFGSYAYGTPTEDSDVDLLVLMEHDGNPSRKSVEIRLKLEPWFALDLLVRTPEVYRQRLEWNDFFLMEIRDMGKVLYDAHPQNTSRGGLGASNG